MNRLKNKTKVKVETLDFETKIKKKTLFLLTLLLLLILSSGCTFNSDCSTLVNSNSETSLKSLDYSNQKEWPIISGKMQSPIDIITTDLILIDQSESELQLDYSDQFSEIKSNEHGLEVYVPGKSLINGRKFDLQQFHIHSESEHTIDGKHYPLEVHFVHKSQSGRIAVVAVFFQEGESNVTLQEILDVIDGSKRTAFSNLNGILPTDKSHFHYLGSLTTPPLTENVEWYVVKSPQEASLNQIKKISQICNQNNRNIQNLNERKVLFYEE